MSMQKKGETAFRPRARLLLILGEELITNEIIAVVELVKNAYDADATRVKVVLDNVTDAKKGRIVVEDNGVGMDLDTVLNVWLEPATGHRTSQKKQGERTGKFGRPMLGEKGVGRFAAHKLGEMVELITRAEGSDIEVHLVVDWGKFKEDKYLDEVPIHWEGHSPRFFTGQKHGTQISVREFGNRKSWDRRMVHNLATKLKGLNSPFGEKLDFEVDLIAPEFRDLLEEIPDLREIIEQPVYLVDGNVDQSGYFHYTYRFRYLPYGWLSREFQEDEDIRDAKHFADNKTEDEGLRKPVCGSFSVRFRAWDLDPQSLRDTIGSRFYQDFIKPHTGVRLYRDNFRVWPYGELDDDWLSLDLRRVNNPTLRISRNQVVGVVEISQEKNEGLRDKTDREGLIASLTFDDFRQLVTNAIAVLERERRKDKNEVDRLREKKRPEDDVTRAIGGLRAEVEKHRDTEKYGEQIDSVENVYRRRIKAILDPYLVSAGLGIAYALPVHEIIRNVGDLQKLLKRVIEEPVEHQEILWSVNQALAAAGQIEEMVRGVGRMIRRGRPASMSLSAPVRDALDIMKLRLQKEHIQPEFREEERIYIRGQRNLVGTAVLNLIDNSYYWLGHNKPEDRRLVIRVGRDGEGRPRILVMDNGPGIQDDPALLLEPFFTRKPDGSGLGLYIADRIQKAHDGQVVFLNRSDEPDLLDGANVALVFPREKEEK